MTDWTAPKTFVAGEVGTAAEMNTHLRDNTLHLKERFSAAIRVGATMDTEDTTTSTSLEAVLNAQVSLTTTMTSDVVVVASFNAKTSDHTYPGIFRLYRDSTALGSILTDAEEVYSPIALVAHDNDLAAGTYVYKLYHARVGAMGTIYTDQVSIVAIAMPI
jgi:hypothetical protein